MRAAFAHYRALITDTVDTAFRSIWASRQRALLTSLGVITGCMAFTASYGALRGKLEDGLVQHRTKKTQVRQLLGADTRGNGGPLDGRIAGGKSADDFRCNGHGCVACVHPLIRLRALAGCEFLENRPYRVLSFLRKDTTLTP